MSAPTSCNLGWVFEQLVMGNTHLRIQGADSHCPAESTVTYRNALRRVAPLPIVAERGPVTHGSGNPWNTTYPSSASDKYPTDAGNPIVTDPGVALFATGNWHGASRAQQLLWNSNQSNGGHVVRSKLVNSEGANYARGDWYTTQHLAGKSLYYYDDAVCIQKFQTRANRGTALGTLSAIDQTGAATNLYVTPTRLCPAPNSTDDTEVGNIVTSSAAAPIDETGRYFCFCGSVGWRHTGDATTLGDPLVGCHLEGPGAIPGWDTNNHGDSSGGATDLYYTDALLARDLELGATSTARTLVWMNMLGHLDGSRTIAQQLTSWGQIKARQFTAGTTAGFKEQRMLNLLPHYSTSASATLQRQQMDILYDLARNDDRVAYCSIADLTGWSLYDGNGGRQDWLEASTIHFDDLNGAEYVVRRLMQECEQEYKALRRRVYRPRSAR